MKNKLILIIFTLLVIIILNIKLDNNTNEKPMPITEQKEVNVKFIEEKNINTDISNAYKLNLETLPNNLKKHISSITITNENLGEKFSLDIDANILAISYGADIYINDEKFNENVLIHEFFHVYDYKHDWISNSDDFKKVYEKEKELINVSEGNSENIYEFWASAGEKYYFHPDELKEIAPLTFKFFKENISL